MDDEQGPWWTRPPEPGPQAPPVPRRPPGGPQDVDLGYPPAEEELLADQGPAAYLPPEYTAPEAPPSGYAPPAYQPPESVAAAMQTQQTQVSPFAAPPAEATQLIEPVPEPLPPPEPSPPPKPAKPVVRRVAVVPPTPPPVRTVGHEPAADRTETLPAISDDIFATFSGPLPVDSPIAAGRSGRLGGPDPAPGTADPLAGPPAGRPPHRLPHIDLPEPRVLLLAAGAALVVLLIVVVALLSGRGTGKDQATRNPVANPSAVTGAAALTGRQPDGLKRVSDDDAMAQLRKAGQGPGGAIVEAWSWKDKNGLNLVVTTMASAGANKRTLRVIHVAGLDGDARTLRVMRDPNLPARCKGAGTARFTPKALVVRDLDSDNVAEVMAGWSSRCGGANADSQIRLALISDGEKYIIRGKGVLGEAGRGSSSPDPGAKSWPDGFLKIVKERYTKLYG